MKRTPFRITLVPGAVLGLVMMLTACDSTIPRKGEIGPAAKSPLTASTASTASSASVWVPLAEDGLHDPKNPGIHLLQEPVVALSTLPANKLRMNVGSYRTPGLRVNSDGNKVDWVGALRTDIISPRRARTPPTTAVEVEELVMDMDMFLDLTGSMPIVRFPHIAHTIWLACSNCHPAVFVPQSGANRIGMDKILSGEQCGICHRAVAFPPTDCARCHSISHNSPEGIKVKAEARAKIEEREKIKAEAAARTKAQTPTKEKMQTKKVGAQP